MEMKTRRQDIEGVGIGRIDLRNIQYFPHEDISSTSFETVIDEGKKKLRKKSRFEWLKLSVRWRSVIISGSGVMNYFKEQ